MDSFLSYKLFQIGSFTLTVKGIISAALILFVTKLVIFVLNGILLKRYFRKRDIDFGRSYAVRTIIRYVLYFIAILIILKSFGLQLSVVLLGSAGLLVGIGLGLQNTFNDLLSGVILLIEGDIAVADIVVIDGMVGVVQKIGLRTSTVKTRDMVSIIVPNSKLVGQNVTNWSHNENPARFEVHFGVSYGSDIDRVEEIALETANQDINVLEKPAPMVFLIGYGDSSVNFILYFFSDEFFYIERVKSDIRKALFKNFRKNNIEIPFPQRDVWFKNAPPPPSN